MDTVAKSFLRNKVSPPSGGCSSRAAKLLAGLVIALSLAAGLPSGIVAPVFLASALAEDAVLKPDVPKLDTLLDSPDRSTLKGTVERRASLAPPKKKKLSAAAASAGGSLSAPLKGRSDSFAPIKGKTQEQTLNNGISQEFTLDRSVGIIGVKFYKLIHGPAVINRVFQGTPAGKNGLQVNDMIVAVDGVPTQNLSKDQCYDLIVGMPNTPVTISVLRGNGFEVKQLIRMDFNDIPDPAVRRDYLRSL